MMVASHLMQGQQEQLHGLTAIQPQQSGSHDCCACQGVQWQACLLLQAQDALQSVHTLQIPLAALFTASLEILLCTAHTLAICKANAYQFDDGGRFAQLLFR